MSRALASLALLGAAAAQHVCMDDGEQLQRDVIVTTGVGPGYTCGQYKDTLFQSTLYRHDDPPILAPNQSYCLEPINVTLPHMSGVMIMPREEMMKYMAEVGCCGNTTDIICDIFPTKPYSCDDDATWYYWRSRSNVPISSKTCLPCHATHDPTDGECRQCVSWDVSGCRSREECEAFSGKWDEAEHDCIGCNAWDAKGCNAEECTHLGGRMMPDGDREECRLCNITSGNFGGCPQDTCEQMGFNYMCDNPERCECRQCCLDGGTSECHGSWHGCRKDQCVPDGSVMDVKWLEWRSFYQSDTSGKNERFTARHCFRCINDGKHFETSGCMNRNQCRDVGANWLGNCEDEGRGIHCCKTCDRDDLRYCEEDQCKDNGGDWHCRYGRCECGRCCIGDHCDGHYGACGSRETCESLGSGTVWMLELNPVWNVDTGEREMVEEGICRRCFSDDTDYYVDGCSRREMCDGIGGWWRCDEDEGRGIDCCKMCTPDVLGYCRDHDSCVANGGDYGCHSEGECWCGRCCPDGYSEDCKGYSYMCSKEQCNGTAKWVNSTHHHWSDEEERHVEVAVGNCASCTNSWRHRDTYGCTTRSECSTLDYHNENRPEYIQNDDRIGEWQCGDRNESLGDHCCRLCQRSELHHCRSEDRCSEMGGTWLCHGDLCMCGMCCLEGWSSWCPGHWTHCQENECRTASNTDTRWITLKGDRFDNNTMQQVEFEYGMCARCFEQDGHYEKDGCNNRNRCQNRIGGHWICDEHEGEAAHCCRICSHSRSSECWDRTSCEGADHSWCPPAHEHEDGWCGSDHDVREHCHPQPLPQPLPQSCTRVIGSTVDRLEDLGWKLSPCK